MGSCAKKLCVKTKVKVTRLKTTVARLQVKCVAAHCVGLLVDMTASISYFFCSPSIVVQCIVINMSVFVQTETERDRANTFLKN